MSSLSSEMRRGSPLVEFLAEHPPVESDESRGVEMSERAFWGHINLRGSTSDTGFLTAAAGALWSRIPREPNTVTQSDGKTIAWLGPDEWLVVVPPDEKEGLAKMLEKALDGLHVSVNDISSGQTIIRLRGARARDVLSKGCPVDLHPRAFGAGQCAQSHIAKSNALIIQLDDTPTYDVIVRRSFADYLARWLKHAGMEYDIAVVTG